MKQSKAIFATGFLAGCMVGSAVLYSPSRRVAAQTLHGGILQLTKAGQVPNYAAGPLSFDVKVYGAKGDGTTDDTASFLNARTAAVANGGGTIYFPPTPKCYAFASSVNFTNLHGINVAGGGIPGVGGTVQGGVGSRLCFTGVTTTNPAFDFSGDTYVRVADLDFGYARGGKAPVTLYAQRTQNQGFCEDVVFDHISVQRSNSVASLMTNNCEVMEVSGSYIDHGNVGFLASARATHGIASAYTSYAGGGSMTQVTFRGGKIVGQGIDVLLDGTGTPVSDITFHGTFFANAGPNATGIDCLGNCWSVHSYGTRYELMQASGSVSFLKAEPGASLVDANIEGFDCGGASPCYALYSSQPATVRSGAIAGVSAPVSWVGSLYNLDVRDGSGAVSVVQTDGDIIDCKFTTFSSGAFGYGTGIQNFTYGGNLLADIDRFKNVVCIQNLGGPGSARCNFGKTYGEGEYIASYVHDVCQFLLTFGGSGRWNLTRLTYLNAQAIWGNPGFGTIACPATGNATSLSAIFRGAGDWFVIQKVGR